MKLDIYKFETMEFTKSACHDVMNGYRTIKPDENWFDYLNIYAR